MYTPKHRHRNGGPLRNRHRARRRFVRSLRRKREWHVIDGDTEDDRSIRPQTPPTIPLSSDLSGLRPVVSVSLAACL